MAVVLCMVDIHNEVCVGVWICELSLGDAGRSVW